MATYREFEKFVRETWKVMPDRPGQPEGFLCMHFDLPDNRSQLVMVRKGSSKLTGDTADVISFLGELSGTRLEKALEETSGCVAGGLVKIGEGIAYRLTILLGDVDESEIRTSIAVAAMAADQLEKKFVGGDDH